MGKVEAGCAVIVFNDQGQFLMLKRKSKHATGTYCVPGGWIELYESFENAGRREVKEELGVHVDHVKVVGITNNPFPAENRHTVSVVMAAMLRKGEHPQNMEPEKCESINWYSDWENMPEPLMTRYHDFISKSDLEKYLKSV